MHLEIVGRSDTARIARYARLIDVVFTGNIIFPLIAFIGHVQLLGLEKL